MAGTALATAALVAASMARIAGPAPTPAPGYRLYQPTIVRSTVVDADDPSQPLKYNHDASIARWRGIWIVVWNGNTLPAEGQPGQYNLMATSPDLANWSAPVRAFSDPASSANPVPCGPAACVQWQPNLFALRDGRLGCVWSGRNGSAGGVGGADENRAFFSVLAAPPAQGGKWVNHPIVFGPDASPLVEARGASWSLFATQNPTILGSGRILAPATMTRVGQPIAPDAPAGCANHTFHNCASRISTVLMSDDGGATWRCSNGTTIPGKTWANWEPTVWQASAEHGFHTPAGPGPGPGAVHMFDRFNDPRPALQHGPPADRRLQWATSTDEGETWSPLAPVPVDTVVSRMQVAPQAVGAPGRPQGSPGSRSTAVRRWLMVHNDWNPGATTGCAGRLNTALWLAPAADPQPPGAAAAFAPGIGLSAAGAPAFYPQMWQDGGVLAVVWSSGTSPRSIKTARLPLPPVGVRVVSVRNNSRTLSPRPKQPAAPAEPWLVFEGSQRLETAAPLAVHEGARQLSVGCWVKSLASGSPGGAQALVDARASKAGGFLVGLSGTTPFAFLGPDAVAANATDRNVAPPAGSAASALSFKVRSRKRAVKISDGYFS